MNKRWQNPCPVFTTQFEQKTKDEMKDYAEKKGWSIGQLIQELWNQQKKRGLKNGIN
jgi:hypothetical protein